MNNERLWTRDFIIVSVTNFLISLIYFSLMVTIASYAIDHFHTSTSIAGFAASVFIIGALIGRLWAGRIVEGVGSKRVLIAGTIFIIITSALYFTAINLPLLILIRLLHGIAYGIASTATGTTVAHIIPDSRRGEGIGYYSMSVILATALGPLMGIFLNQHADFNTIFTATTILAVISFAISFIVGGQTGTRPDRNRAKAVSRIHLSDFLEFKAIPISIIALIIGFCYANLISFISLFTKQIHLEGTSSFFFLVYAATVLVSRPFSGRLLDARGANIVVYPCLFIFVIGMLLLSQSNSSFSLLLSGAIIGLGYGNFLSCGQAIAINMVPPQNFGLATATYFIFMDFGIGVGPYLLGLVVPFIGYRGLYVTTSMIILVAVLIYHLLHGRKVSAE